jgi:hypothetical protein
VISDTLKINAGWEKRENRAICRWILVWKEINEVSLAGALGGYSGGGSFQLEGFYAIHSEGQLTNLMIDLEDKITFEEIDFFNDVPKDVRTTCSIALDVTTGWHDQDQWYEGDQLLLRDERRGELISDGDMLLLSNSQNQFMKPILKSIGITAAPGCN